MTASSGHTTPRFVHTHADRLLRSYAPSFFEGVTGSFLSSEHERAEDLVAGIRGKLEPADHLKLYEAAFFTRGDILEIGRLHGKSTVVLAMGLRASGTKRRLVSIEYEDRYLETARQHLLGFGLADYAELLQGDSSTVVRSLAPRIFDTVFVDGDHSFDGVKRDLEALDDRLTPHAVVLFHDYFHRANDEGDYGVKRAVDALAPRLGLQFRGRFGGIALFGRGFRSAATA